MAAVRGERERPPYLLQLKLLLNTRVGVYTPIIFRTHCAKYIASQGHLKGYEARAARGVAFRICCCWSCC